MKTIKIIIIFISILFSNKIKSTNFEKIDFTYLTDKEGLNNAPINYIYQDSIGFLWIATTTELFRYNGKDITNMGEKAPLSKVFTKNIQFITFKNSNFYFVGNDNLNILNIKTNEVNSFNFKDYFDINNYDNKLKNCFIDKENNLWVVTTFSIYKSIKKENKIINFKRIIIDKKEPNLKTSCVYKDRYNNLWVGTKKGLYIYDEKKDSSIYLNNKIYQIQPFFITRIKQDKDSNIWISQTRRLIKINKNQNVFNEGKINIKTFFIKKYSEFSYIKDFNIDNKGNIWVIHPKNVTVIEPTKKGYDQYRVPDRHNKKFSLSSTNIRSLFIDNQGIVFIGTQEGVLNIYNPYNKKIILKAPANYLGSFDVNCSCKDYKGNLWLGVDKHKLFYYLTKEDKFIEINLSSSFSIVNIFETKEHEIFFTSMSKNLTDGGLFRLNNLNSFYKTLDDKELSVTIFNSSNIKNAQSKMALAYFATQDIDGTFWYTVIHEGTYHLNYKKGKMSVIDFFTRKDEKKHGLKNVIGLNFNILRDSSLFISSSLDKPIKYNRENNSFSYPYDYSKQIDPKDVVNITFAYLDKKGRHWFGTDGGGLIRYEKKDSTNFIVFDKKSGLNSNSVFSGLMDENSNMWIGTTFGISVIDTNDNVYNLSNLNGEKSHISKYTGEKLDSTTISFAGQGGLSIINTSTIFTKINNFNAKIGIKKISINGVDYENFKKNNFNIKQLNLKSFQNNIQIEIATLSFSDPKDNTILYRLLPVSKKWKKNNKGNKNIDLNNLKSGNYTLECKVINSDGKVSNITKSLGIFIDKPFYFKWYFIISYLILIVVFVYIIENIFRINIVKRNNKLKKQVNEQTQKLISQNAELASTNATKTKMFSVIAHDLIGPLGTIMTTNHFIIENYNDFVKENRIKPLMVVNDESLSSLYELLQNLLFWSRHQQSKIELNPSKINLFDLCENISTLLKFLLAGKNNNLIIDVPKDLTLFADKQMIHTILRNIISNANKFTAKGTITIKTKDLANYVCISVSDTGIGMSKDKAKSLFTEKEIKSTKGTAGESGTGLGLIVSKEFVLKHKGKIYADSTINKGTTITFCISKNI